MSAGDAVAIKWRCVDLVVLICSMHCLFFLSVWDCGVAFHKHANVRVHYLTSHPITSSHIFLRLRFVVATNKKVRQAADADDQARSPDCVCAWAEPCARVPGRPLAGACACVPQPASPGAPLCSLGRGRGRQLQDGTEHFQTQLPCNKGWCWRL